MATKIHWPFIANPANLFESTKGSKCNYYIILSISVIILIIIALAVAIQYEQLCASHVTIYNAKDYNLVSTPTCVFYSHNHY